MPDTTEPTPSGQILIYQDGSLNLRVRLDGQNAWLSQMGMAELFQTTKQNISLHIQNIYEEGELAPESTVKQYLTVQSEGNRQVRRAIDHYNLEVILSVGYRIRSTRGTQFRQWATQQLAELLVKGFVLDDERIKAGRTIGGDYFDELLARIRDIRASERLFYQKITDIYATSIDYDKNAELTKQFYATVQNKLHWATHRRTAAEVIRDRADASTTNMGLKRWRNAPEGPIRKADVVIAKNYLTQPEIEELNRVVSMYLDYAEDQARKKQGMHMSDWVQKLDGFLRFNERDVLGHKGSVSHQEAIDHAHLQFGTYDARRLLESTSDFDELLNDTRRLETQLPPAEPSAQEKPPKERGRAKGS